MVHIWQRGYQTTDTKIWTSIKVLIQVTGARVADKAVILAAFLIALKWQVS
ncbi:hypothetical protein [Neobacillus massiliamazoniensis]|uniref:hypothetical protein n=1 Tax=Neobacillus massiliamazoniensis TaxID=1499688 RepID=UPI00159EF3FB|nr:hypothetical protein [Neobacillus massiliamazoniensis]